MSNFPPHDNRPAKKTVLIIDQDQELVESLAVRCRSIGLEAWTALDVSAAAKLMAVKMPDLLCVDTALPFGNGETFLERLSHDHQARTIPAIVLGDQPDRRIESLCAYYVPKSLRSWPRIETFINELVDISSSNICDISTSEFNSENL